MLIVARASSSARTSPSPPIRQTVAGCCRAIAALVEKRYDRNEVKELLEYVGLVNVAVRSCGGWVADGTEPG
jgi:hypothetical protein